MTKEQNRLEKLRDLYGMPNASKEDIEEQILAETFANISLEKGIPGIC